VGVQPPLVAPTLSTATATATTDTTATTATATATATAAATTAISATSSAADNRARLYAFDNTFILAPSFSIRIGLEDFVLLHSFVASDGPAILLLSEFQPRLPTRQFHLDMAPTLGHDASRVLTEDNAGGSSYISEAMSLELLYRSFGAKLSKTELELNYWPSNGAITDFSITLGEVNLGVSVTRALRPPTAPPFSEVDADCLLKKKLQGVIDSTKTCCNGRWTKQMLHIWAQSHQIAEKLKCAYENLEPELIHDTVVLVTVCQGMPELFMEKSRVERRSLRVLKGLKDERHLAVLAESDPCAQQKLRDATMHSLKS